MRRTQALTLLKTNLRQIQQNNAYALMDLQMLNEKLQDSDDEEIRLNLSFNNCLADFYFHSKYKQAAQKALEVIEKNADTKYRVALAAHHWAAGNCMINFGDLDNAQIHLNNALDILHEANVESMGLVFDVYHSMAHLHFMLGADAEYTLDLLEKAYDSLDPDDRDTMTVRNGTYYIGKGNVLVHAERPREALDNYLKAQVIYEKIFDIQNLALCATNIATCYITLRDPYKAEEYLLKSLELLSKAGSPQDKSISYHNLGIVYQMRSDWDEAKRLFLKRRAFLLGTGNEEDLKEIDEMIELVEKRLPPNLPNASISEKKLEELS